MATKKTAAKSKPGKSGAPKAKRGRKPGAKAATAPAAKAAPAESWVGRVPPLRPGTDADGLPIHDVTYLCCKLMLRPNHFVSRDSLFEFAEVMRAPAKEHGVELSTKGYRQQPLKIREVLFIDTHDFRLYNNAFILRRRIP